MTATAGFVRNGRLDILAANPLGHALYAPVFDRPAPAPANLARFVFLDPRARDFYRDWDGIAHAAVGSLRAEAGRDPYDRALTDLIGELSTRSEPFRIRWAAHDVRYYRSGIQPFHHPLVGDLDLDYDALELPADPGQTIIVYSAEPGSAAGPGTWHPRQLGRYPTTSGTAQYGRAPGRAHLGSPEYSCSHSVSPRTAAMSRAPARSREVTAVRTTSAGSRPTSSAACRVRNNHRA